MIFQALSLAICYFLSRSELLEMMQELETYKTGNRVQVLIAKDDKNFNLINFWAMELPQLELVTHGVLESAF